MNKAALVVLIFICNICYCQSISDTIPKKQKTNFYLEINYCSGIGNGNTNNASSSMEEFSYGFRVVEAQPLSEEILIGIGLGIDRYSDATLLPISADARIRFVKGNISGIFNPNLGYAIGLKKAHGGFMLNPAMGIEMPSKDKSIYLFAVGFKLQKQRVTQVHVDYFGNNFSDTEKFNLQFISFSAGLKF